jgi:hypothetical protein
MELPEVPELVAPAPEHVPAYDYNIAMLIDNVVYQVMNVDSQQAAQFMSQPTFIQVGSDAKVGWQYIDGKFVSPFAQAAPVNSGV